MERDETKDPKMPSAEWETKAVPSRAEEDQEILSESVLAHIRQLLSEDQRAPNQVSKAKEGEGAHTSCDYRALAQVLEEILADQNLRAVLVLHFGTWLKEHPVKHWLWECFHLLDTPENLQDPSYMCELMALLEKATHLAVEAREDPALMRSLLRRLLTSPAAFMT